MGPSDVVNEKEESLKKEETSLTQINISDDIKDKNNSTLHQKLEVGDPVDMQKKTLDHVSKSDKSIEKAEDKKEESTKDMDQSNLEAKLNEEKSSKDMEDLTKIEDIKENVSEGISQGEEISNNKVNEENDIRNESEKVQAEENELKRDEFNSMNKVPVVHTPENSHSESEDLNDINIADGVLNVEIIEASKLVNKDMIGKSDPYVKLKFKKDEFISKKVRNSLEPKWNFLSHYK